MIGTLSISGAFAARRVLSDWWLLLITGLLEIPLGVLALAQPGGDTGRARHCRRDLGTPSA